MNYFGPELQLGLTNHIGEEASFIRVVIPEVGFRFFKKLEIYMDVDLDCLIQYEPDSIRYLHEEEVKEINELMNALLKKLKDESIKDLYSEFRNEFYLTEADFQEDDVIELINHIIYLCQTSLNGTRILYISTGYDDTAAVEG